VAFKVGDFKTCSQSGFCRSGRDLAARGKDNVDTWRSPYSVDARAKALAPDRALLTAAVKSALYPDSKFILEIRVHEDGVVRVRMDEVGRLGMDRSRSGCRDCRRCRL
jgi:alpha 1,3-glucosidase